MLPDLSLSPEPLSVQFGGTHFGKHCAGFLAWMMDTPILHFNTYLISPTCVGPLSSVGPCPVAASSLSSCQGLPVMRNVHRCGPAVDSGFKK